MIKEVLTKNVTLTVKDLLISGAVVFGEGVLIAGATVFGLNRKRINRIKSKYNLKSNEKINTLTEANKELEKELLEATKKMAYYAKKLYASDIVSPNEILNGISNLKLSEENKLLIYEYYTRNYNDIFTSGDEFINANELYCSKIVVELKNINKQIKDNDINSLNLLAKQIDNNNKKQEETRRRYQEENKERRQREHEIAMKQEENKKYEEYLEHLETMKKMDIDSQNMKTAAFAGVAKSAINVLDKKEKEEE